MNWCTFPIKLLNFGNLVREKRFSVLLAQRMRHFLIVFGCSGIRVITASHLVRSEYIEPLDLDLLESVITPLHDRLPHVCT